MVDQPEKVELATPDLAAQRRAALEELFPDAIADGVLDAARIGELIDLQVARLPDGRERYGLQWAGKQEAIRSLLTPSRATLVPDPETSISFDTAENVFIEGDNLEVLKLLQKAYNDRVKLIYIDPPYNTGNDFVYDDDFSDGLRGYLEYTGQLDEEGNRTSADAEKAGRKHSRWLNMMYPRLMLARNLLTQDGAIFVSIDDNEVKSLRAVMDQVFGEENFIGQMIWAAGRKNDSKLISESHEYILVYARSLSSLIESVGKWRTKKDGLEEIYARYEKLLKVHGNDHAAVSDGLKEWFRALPEGDPSKRHKHYCNVDARGIYFADNISWPGGGGPKYEVLHPTTGKPVRIPSRGWLVQEARMKEWLADDRVHFGADETSVPTVKAYLDDRTTEVPYSVFYVDGRGATKRLRALLGGNYFENPKDETVLKRIIEFASGDGDTVMDFFAGSGTTAHAVALQNAEDGLRRRYVLVNLPEPTPEGSDAAMAGYDTVSAITLARLQAVADVVPGAETLGLRTWTLSESNFRSPGTSEEELDLVPSTLSRDELDWDAVAAEVLLKEGVPLDAPWQRLTIAGADVVISSSVAVIISLSISDELVLSALEMEASVVVFLEDGFKDGDAVKANAVANAVAKNKILKTV